MSDSETEVEMSTKPTSKNQDEPFQKNSNLFHNIKFFVFCQSMLQLTQLMISGSLKSSISTIEKRFGLTSQTSGLLVAFNEVGNTALIVFVSYFGCRVHRPRLIGLGAVVVAMAGLLMSLPHFISDPYYYDHVSLGLHQDSASSLCLRSQDPEQARASVPTPSNSSCAFHSEAPHTVVVGLMFLAQTLLGVGAVPIQPFGISYIDDFAHPSNSPLYLGILFAVTLIGPGVAFALGSVMLRFYVDFDRIPEGDISLNPKDPRWVGAWWLGFLITAGAVILTALPYFFFPRDMPKEQQELGLRKRILPALDDKGENSVIKQRTDNFPDKKKDEAAQIAPDLTVIQFIKIFPKVLLRNLRHPIFLLVILAQVSMTSMVAGMATFLPKFLERQFSITASYANLLVGSISVPGAILGIITGSVVVHRFHLNSKYCAAVGIGAGFGCLTVGLPLFITGCPTHHIANIFGPSTFPENEEFLNCTRLCSCSKNDFNPVCDIITNIEYITPCQAGCTGFQYDADLLEEFPNLIIYTNCTCLLSRGEGNKVVSGSCESSCTYLVIPFMLLVCVGTAVATLAHIPSFMLILRGVKNEDKSLALGIQFMLLRILAWMPSPVLHGSAIDSTCVFWADICGMQSLCRYYNHDLLRHRFIGLQMFFKLSALFCFILVFTILQQQEKEAARSGSQHELQEGKLVLNSDNQSGESTV
ncbi:solute carrier organic anion transporter family member 2B1 isoform X2 [Antechinus flavipes]|nr:solute carrier organic anion transporter family member 2B1 isoform X2 [Antechinus flavipes]